MGTLLFVQCSFSPILQLVQDAFMSLAQFARFRYYVDLKTLIQTDITGAPRLVLNRHFLCAWLSGVFFTFIEKKYRIKLNSHLLREAKIQWKPFPFIGFSGLTD